MSQISKLTNERLIEALHFTEKDLIMNRQMKLSQKQKVKIKPTVDLFVSVGILGTIVFFSLALFILMKGFDFIGLFGQTILSMAGFGLCFYWTFESIQLQDQFKKYKGIKYIEGTAEFSISYKLGFFQNGEVFTFPAHFMKIAGFKFELDENTYDSIQGSIFRVYYFESFKKTFLSIENID